MRHVAPSPHALILGVQYLSSPVTALLIVMCDGALCIRWHECTGLWLFPPVPSGGRGYLVLQCNIASAPPRNSAFSIRRHGCGGLQPFLSALFADCSSSPIPRLLTRQHSLLMRNGTLSSCATAPSSSPRATALLLLTSSLRNGVLSSCVTAPSSSLCATAPLFLASHNGASPPPCAMALLSSRAMVSSASSESSASALLCLFHATTCLSLLRDNAPPSPKGIF
ncbi:hypothetical protein C8R44DRAFT_887986 [Mycena epipterygia]|nr:hypothetical protein C8R44DRAFT_887986 [Mycena epipterygia]